MWIRQLVRGSDARGAGYSRARERGSDEYIAFHEVHQPIVEGLLRSGARVVVACDRERADYTQGRPAVILAWAVLTDTTVYGVGIKRDFAREGFGADLARAVLGEALDEPMSTVLDIVDIKPPPQWGRERNWGSALRQVVQRHRAEDAVFASVVGHIVDPQRVPWVPSEERAA